MLCNLIINESFEYDSNQNHDLNTRNTRFLVIKLTDIYQNKNILYSYKPYYTVNRISETIKEYCNSSTRNKLIITSSPIEGVKFSDVGREYSEKLNLIQVDLSNSLAAKHELELLLKRFVKVHSKFGEIMALKNVGILLEPELKLDFIALIERLSKSHPLFLEWKGEMEADIIYHLRKNGGIKLKLKSLSYISL